MRALLLAAVGALLFLPAPAAADDDILVPKDGELAVSFTFDGGYKGQDVAAQILADREMAGTFYVNSGYLDYPAYLSIDELRVISRQRHEIGGASLYNNNLTDIDMELAVEQVCDDRATLSQLGFQVTSFAYPYGDDSVQAKAAAEQCGYNSGRAVSGLYFNKRACSDCPEAEPLPPVDDMRIRSVGFTNNVDGIKRSIVRARDSGGGWMPLIFSHICVCPELGDDAISPAALEELVTWVNKEPTIKVYRVDQIMGGPLQEISGEPLQRLMPGGVDATPPDDSLPLSSAPAVTVLGYGINQTQVILIGLIVALTLVLTYRSATRQIQYTRLRSAK